MSWVLVAWDGQDGMVPSNAAEAARILDQLEADTPEGSAPTARIRDYVDELLGRWPDIFADGGEESPWADGPLISNAYGPLFVFSLRVSTLEESIPYCTDVARRHGIVLFDQEQEEIYSPAGIVSASGTAVRPPPPRPGFFRRK